MLKQTIAAQIHSTHLVGQLLCWGRGLRGHAAVWRLSISSRSCWWSRITEQGKHMATGRVRPRHRQERNISLDSAHSSRYLCGPLCCMFGLNWLDSGGGGMPTEETGGFIAPAETPQVRRIRNNHHSGDFCSNVYIRWQSSRRVKKTKNKAKQFYSSGNDRLQVLVLKTTTSQRCGSRKTAGSFLPAGGAANA